MLLPISWLKEFIELDQDVYKISEKLVEHSCEVEDIIDQKKHYQNIFIGKIDKIESHPDADKLVVCQVSVLDKKLQIVTGATNIFEGAVIPVATEGAVLPDGLVIKSSKLRGLESQGMLCSEKELALSEEAKGIMILDEKAPLSMNIADYLNINEQLLDISITPNRGDLLSVRGLAKEISAIYSNSVKDISANFNHIIKKEVNLNVLNYVNDLCNRYMGVVIKGIKIGQSPEWMQKKLKSVDITPINNIVDITNFVLYECGQPLHAFSFDKLNDAKIIIRRAKENEKLKVLNNQELILNIDDLVISDSAQPIALAGIIGGFDSAIHENTVDIVLESASFNPVSVRRSSFAKGIRTESSQRFEKGVDFYNVEFAFKRAINLIMEICGGYLASEIQDVYAAKPQVVQIEMNHQRVNDLLGTNISAKEINNILTRLSFVVEGNIVTVPSFRSAEVTREADLIEEIGRIYGYNNIQDVLPVVEYFEQPSSLSFFDISKKIRDFCVSKGLSEIISYSMVSPLEDQSLFDKKMLELQNPLTSSESVLRTNLFISLLKNYDYNNRNLVNYLNTFEVGKVFHSNNDKIAEELRAGILISSSITKTTSVKASNEFDFYKLKGISDELLEYLNIKQTKTSNNDLYSFFHPTKSAKISVGKDTLSVFGEVHPAILEKYDIKKTLFFLEIFPEKIVKYQSNKKKYKKFSLYPLIKRELSFWIDKNIPYENITKIINDTKSAYLKDIFLVDIYDGNKYGEEKINYVIQLVFQDNASTLDENTVTQEFNKIIEKINNKLEIIFA
jgi:phenylalanyl-tRNA synthetase beta chain